MTRKILKEREVWESPWLARVLSFIGAGAYLVQAWILSHKQSSVLDEGAYLVKGFLYASGRYWPFQEYGPWTNHMPLSFLIPGYVQNWFGPGLRTGRYYAFVLSALILVGVWIVSKRMAGGFLAALAVWALALNTAAISVYSIGVSQVLIAAMLTWVFVLTLGGDRPLWQVLLGVGLASSMVVTRINLAPILILLLLYIFWEYDHQIALVSLVVAVVFILFYHALFWPGIMSRWLLWVPKAIALKITPSMPETGVEFAGDIGLGLWAPSVSFDSRIVSFLDGVRSNFVPMIGAFTVWLLWPRKEAWKTKSHYRASMFLSLFFGLLLLLHMFAALGKDYCVFCLSGYITYFSVSALLLVVIASTSWGRDVPKWRQGISILLILGVGIALGFRTFNDLGVKLVNLNVPRIVAFFRTGEVLPAYIPLWEVIQVRAGIGPEILKRILPTAIGFLIAAAAIFVAWRAKRYLQGAKYPLAALALITFLVFGGLLSPTPLLGWRWKDNGGGCDRNTIAAYEQIGAYLSEHIPPGSKVYWLGGLSSVPLLYLPEAQIFPAQLNNGYSYRQGGDTETLERYGLWNKELAHEWALEGDYALIKEEHYGAEWFQWLALGEYEEIGRTIPADDCAENSRIILLKRTR